MQSLVYFMVCAESNCSIENNRIQFREKKWNSLFKTKKDLSGSKWPCSESRTKDQTSKWHFCTLIEELKALINVSFKKHQNEVFIIIIAQLWALHNEMGDSGLNHMPKISSFLICGPGLGIAVLMRTSKPRTWGKEIRNRYLSRDPTKLIAGCSHH